MTLHSFSWCLLTHAGLEVPLHCAPGCVDINYLLALSYSSLQVQESQRMELLKIKHWRVLKGMATHPMMR